MLKMSSLDEQISAYYDEQLNPSEVMSFEARMARSNCVQDYANERCFDYYKITTSINRINKRLLKYSYLEYGTFLKEYTKSEKGSLLEKIKNFFAL